MDLQQREFNCIKEEPFDIEIKDELCLYNETQTKYEVKRGKTPHDYKKTFQCTKCDFISTSSDTSVYHTCYNCTLNSSLLSDSKRLKVNNDSPIFVKHDDINIIVKPRFVCSVCGISKSKWVDIQQHTNKLANVSSKYICKECHFNTDIDSEFEIHKLVHKMKVNLYYNKWTSSALIQVPIKCSECEYTSLQEVRMERHMVKHTSETPFKCKHIGCIYAAKLPNNLRAHLKTHRGNKLITCTGCEYKTTQRSQFKVHMKEYHNNFQCQECKRIFNSNDILEMHELSHKEHSSTNNLECNDDFRNNIEKDIKSNGNINLEDEQFECSLCDYISTSEKDIQEHSSICNCITD